MFWAKLHILLVVCAVQHAAVFVDNALPYWPIEVSRMAASGPVALQRFQWGMTLLGVTLLASGELSAINGALWAALVIIAWVDDVTSWAIHMVGVALMGVVVAWQVWTNARTHTWALGAAGFIYGIRVVAKAAAVVWYELPPSGVTMEAVFARSMDIMQGRAKCHAPVSLFVFQAGGVLQWVVFLLFSAVF